MYNQEELDYQMYLIRAVLSDIMDELNLLKNRESFLLSYGVSAKDAHEIDHLFTEIALDDKEISLSEFSKKLNERITYQFAPKVIKELLEAYKEYEPVALSKIK
ncbi:hypothetical protein [Lactobacillus kalixensis]|nr:hypothetical protein [Lactobacillus kalixensis]